MKKLLAIVLTLVLVVGMGTAALATVPSPPTDMEEVNLDKHFDLKNDDSKRPAETFEFTIEPVGVTDSWYYQENPNETIPMFDPDTFDITFSKGDTVEKKSKTLALPLYDYVGIYTYKITENIPVTKTAGVTYDDKVYYLIVTVINELDEDGDLKTDADGKPILIRQVTSLYYLDDNDEKVKDQEFTNEFSSGELAITKVVTGNLGDRDRYFTIDVELTAPENTVISSVPVSYDGGKYTDKVVTFTDGVATLSLEIKHDDTITFYNLPYGVTWTIEEEDLSGEYEVTNGDVDGTVSEETDTITITNDKDQTVETGINLDSLPYLIILAVAIGGLILFITRRRQAANE